MRAQFFILSVVIIIITIVTFATGILETTSPSFIPRQEGFLLNNLESEAEQAFIVGKSRNTLETTFREFTETTKEELARDGISLDWDYTLSSGKIDAQLTLKTGDTTITDSFTLS